MKILIVAALSALSLAACTSAPAPREAHSAYSEGYTQRALSSNRYLVEYCMDGADYQRAYDLALWRAAQLTLQHGYPSFEVVSRDTSSDPGARASTSFTTQYATAYQRTCGLLSCTETARPSIWNGVQVSSDGRRPSRVVSLEVVFMRDLSAEASNRYVAAEVIRHLEAS